MFKQINEKEVFVSEFTNMIEVLSSFIPSRTNVEEYKCLRFFDKNKVIAGDDSFSAIFSFQNNLFDRNFSIDGKLLASLVKKLKVAEKMKLALNENNLTIVCEKTRSRFSLHEATAILTYKEPEQFCLAPEDFIAGLNFLDGARASSVFEASKPSLLGIRVQNGKGYASNTYIISEYKFDAKDDKFFDELTIHKQLFEFIKKYKVKPYKIGLDEKFIYVYYGNFVLRAIRLAAQYEKYIDLEGAVKFNKELTNTIEVSVAPDVLLDALSRLEVVKDGEGKAKIKIKITPTEMEITNAESNCDVVELVDCSIVSDVQEIEIGVVANHLSYLVGNYKAEESVRFFVKKDRTKILFMSEDEKCFNVCVCLT